MILFDCCEIFVKDQLVLGLFISIILAIAIVIGLGFLGDRTNQQKTDARSREKWLFLLSFSYNKLSIQITR